MQTLPPFNWRIPSPTDPPNVPYWFGEFGKDVAATVAPIATPVSSNSVSWATGFAQGTVGPTLFKVGRIVMAQFMIKRTGVDIVGSGSTGNITNTLMVTITDPAFRPLTGTEGILKTGSNGPLAGGYAASDGKVFATAFCPGGRWVKNTEWSWHGEWITP